MIKSFDRVFLGYNTDILILGIALKSPASLLKNLVSGERRTMSKQKSQVSPKKKSEFDGPWKGILDLYFKDFMFLCWPEKHAIIDWTKGVKMLDKDLLKISKNAAISNRYVDKLIEIHCLSGEINYLVLHLEIQRSAQANFETRMLQYRCRLKDLYNKPIASLAVLIDPDPHWRPNSYREEVWGSTLEMTFPIVKLTDFQERISELKESKNCFAHVILAQLALNKQESPEQRLATKFELTRNLYKMGWSGEDIRALYKFVDWIMVLPPELEETYTENVMKIEKDLEMNYVSTAERVGIRKGMQQGECAVVLHLLETKFKEVPSAYQAQLRQMDSSALLELAKRILSSQSLDALFKS